MVLTSVAVMGGAATIKGLTGPASTDSKFRRLWAVGALGVVLSLLADFAPQVAGPLAVLTALGYALGAESQITGFVHGAVGSQAASSTPAHATVAAGTTRSSTSATKPIGGAQ